MKTTNTFYWSFIDTLIYNIATISAIVVGLYQFAVRAWTENNGNEKARKFLIQTLRFVNTLTATLYANLNHEMPESVPVKKVAQRRTKRA